MLSAPLAWLPRYTSDFVLRLTRSMLVRSSRTSKLQNYFFVGQSHGSFMIGSLADHSITPARIAKRMISTIISFPPQWRGVILYLCERPARLIPANAEVTCALFLRAGPGL